MLMGMSKLPRIAEIYKEHGKEDLPVSIIQSASTSGEKIGVGTVNTINEVVERKGFKNPAVILLGEVVKHSHKFQEFFSSETVKNA